MRSSLLSLVVATLCLTLWGGAFTTFTAGCSSSSSAPPVSLPAPVTGRVTVTSPDEDGVALVVGEEEAVTGGSLVHVLNQTQATSLTLGLLSILPSAFAQATLPAICNRPFHGCGRAEDDGSFEIEIQASEDDEIAVEVIDETSGTATSERIEKSVPRNMRHFVGPVVDVEVLPAEGKLYALIRRGTLDAPENGLVSIVDVDDFTRAPTTFDGTRPSRMVFHRETLQGVVTDRVGNFAALVDLNTNNFDQPDKVELPNPTDVVFTTAGDAIIVGSGPALRSLSKIDPATLTVTDVLNEADLGAGTTPVATWGLDLLRVTTTDPPVDLVALVGTFNIGGTDTPAIALLDAANFTLISNLTSLPDGTDPHDVAFFQTASRLLVTDTGNDRIWVYSYTLTPAAGGPLTATLTLEGSIADAEGVIVEPRRIAIDPANQLAFVNARNHTDERPDTVLTIDLATQSIVDLNAIGFNPSGLVWDADDGILFSSTIRTRAVTFYTLPQLLP